MNVKMKFLVPVLLGIAWLVLGTANAFLENPLHRFYLCVLAGAVVTAVVATKAMNWRPKVECAFEPFSVHTPEESLRIGWTVESEQPISKDTKKRLVKAHAYAKAWIEHCIATGDDPKLPATVKLEAIEKQQEIEFLRKGKVLGLSALDDVVEKVSDAAHNAVAAARFMQRSARTKKARGKRLPQHVDVNYELVETIMTDPRAQKEIVPQIGDYLVAQGADFALQICNDPKCECGKARIGTNCRLGEMLDDKKGIVEKHLCCGYGPHPRKNTCHSINAELVKKFREKQAAEADLQVEMETISVS